MFEVDLKKALLEKDIENAVCNYAESKGMLQWKFTSPNKRSVPDRIFMLKNGWTFFIEFKKPGGVLTSGQEREIARIVKQSSTVYIVDNIDKGKEIIDWYVR